MKTMKCDWFFSGEWSRWVAKEGGTFASVGGYFLCGHSASLEMNLFLLLLSSMHSLLLLLSGSGIFYFYFFMVERRKNNDSFGFAETLRSFIPREIRKFY